MAEIKPIRKDIEDRVKKGDIVRTIYLIGVILTGCIPKSGNTSIFLPTPSVCLDGLVYNMAYDGCDNIDVKDSTINGTQMIECTYSHVYKNSQSSLWRENDFYIVNTGTDIGRIEGGSRLCSDGHLTIVVVEND
jgi:hypothetical protein